MEWFGIVVNAPVSVGYCSLLFIGFILLPSAAWLCNSLSTRNMVEVKRSLKDMILSPKTVSLLLLLCSILLPAVILWDPGPYTSSPYTPLAFVGFLLQFQFSRSMGPPDDSFSILLQEPFTWRYYGVSIIVSLANLLFVWTVMRYALGKGSKRTAYITGIATQIPSLVYMISGTASSDFSQILPFPATFVIGLILLRYVRALEPPKEREGKRIEESEMKVPFILVLKSRFSAWRQRSKEHDAIDEESNEKT